MQPNRYPQPVTVLVIGCILLVYALVAVWTPVALLIANAASWPDPVFLTCAMVLPPLLAICGSFILRGAAWARALFFAACIPLYLVLVAWKGEHFGIVGILPPFSLSLFLISAPANRYFTGRETFFKAQQHDALAGQRERGGRYEY
jgi:hypothetical protein